MIWGGLCTYRFAAMVSSKEDVWPRRDWPSTRMSRWCGFDLWKIYKFVFVFELAIWTSMNEQINLQIAKSLERVKSSIDYWDSSKCPPVRWKTTLWLLLPDFWSKYCSLIDAFQIIREIFFRTYMQNIGLIPADDEETSSANSVGARFHTFSCRNII